MTDAFVVLFLVYCLLDAVSCCDKKLLQIQCQTSVLEYFPSMNFIPHEAIFFITLRQTHAVTDVLISSILGHTLLESFLISTSMGVRFLP